MLQTLLFLRQTARLASLRTRTPGQMLDLQKRRFRQMIQYAYHHSSFYRQRFRGFDLERCQPGDLPPLSKAEMMENFEEIVTDPRITRAGVERFIADPANLGKLYLGQYVPCHTSGSQGQPALIVQDYQDITLAFSLQVARGHAQAKNLPAAIRRLLNPNRMAIVTMRPGFYPSGVAFAYMPDTAKRFTNILRLSLTDPQKEIVARLNEFRPHFLTGYATVLEMLAREELAGRLRLREARCLELLTNMSEPLTPGARAFIEKTFGVHISDHYAMGECMGLCVGCAYHPGAHLNVDLALLEVVDDEFRPVPPGSAGTKVLISNLYNRVQPFIRYIISDVITMSPKPCPCGSNLPLISNIQGRTKDKFWVEVQGEYRELMPFLVQAALLDAHDVAEYQMIQTERNRFLIRAAPVPGRTVSREWLANLISRALEEDGFGKVVALDIELVPEIKPDPRSGKMKRLQSLVGPPPGMNTSGLEGLGGAP